LAGAPGPLRERDEESSRPEVLVEVSGHAAREGRSREHPKTLPKLRPRRRPEPGNERRSAGRRSSSCVVAGAAGRSWSGKAGEGRLRPASPPPWQGPGWPLALEEVRDVQVLLLGVDH